MPDSTATRILTAVEYLSAEACGAFLVEVDGEHVGSVLIESTQVCWCAAAGLRRRLLELLRESLLASVDPAELDELAKRCVAEGRRIGEELTARSMVSNNVMRAAIKQHTIESLIALPERRGERVRWVGHRAQGYHPRFTFSPVELYVGVNARLYAAESIGAEIGLALVEDIAPAATFARDDEGAPIAVKLLGDHPSIIDVIELGVWADAAFGATSGFSREVVQRVIAASTGELVVAWRTSRHFVHAAIVSDREALHRLLAALERRGHPTVVSRRARSHAPVRRDPLDVIDHTP